MLLYIIHTNIHTTLYTYYAYMLLPPIPTHPYQLLLAVEVVEVKFDKLFTIYHNQPVQCSPQSHVDSFYRSALCLYHLLSCLHVPVTKTVLLLDLTRNFFIGLFRNPSAGFIRNLVFLDCLFYISVSSNQKVFFHFV